LSKQRYGKSTLQTYKQMRIQSMLTEILAYSASTPCPLRNLSKISTYDPMTSTNEQERGCQHIIVAVNAKIWETTHPARLSTLYVHLGQRLRPQSRSLARLDNDRSAKVHLTLASVQAGSMLPNELETVEET
jgi:hypothetical protein